MKLRRSWASRATAVVVSTTLAASFAVSGFCYPPPSPAVCMRSAPTSPASYAWVFNQRYGAWSGGDSSHTVQVGADTYWLFADSFMDGGKRFVNNSIVRQHGRCFAPLTYGTSQLRLSPLQSSRPGFLWPDGGVYDPVHHTLLILSDRAVMKAGGLPGWNFELQGSDITTIKIISPTHADGARSVPSPAPQKVAGLSWDSLVQDGTYIYIHGRVGDSEHVVARATLATFASGPWLYWTGTSWSRYWSNHRPMSFDVAPLAVLEVVKVKGGFMASAARWGIISNDVYAWFSPTAHGPWRPLGKVADVLPPRAGWMTYHQSVVWLPGAGWTLMWSQNALSPKDSDWRIYGIRFAKATAPAVLKLEPRP